MKNKILLWINVILSSFLLVSFTIVTVNDILNVGNTYFWLICYSFPFTIALLLAILSIIYRPKIISKLKYLPLAINILTIIIGISLFEFNHLNPDFGFLQVYKDYDTVTNLIINDQIQIDNNGFVALPSNLAHTSLTGNVYVSKDKNITTIYFLDDTEPSDGFSWGYLYRSDGSEPSPSNSDKQNRGQCSVWRAIQPPKTNWFYCEAHQVFVFPGWY